MRQIVLLTGLLWPSGFPLAQEPSTPESSIIAELRGQLASGGRGAEAAFWERVGAAGTPLVEPIPAGGVAADSFLVTLVWRGDASTKSVLLVSPRALQDIGGEGLQHISGTDVWYWTRVLPKEARFTYRFGPNDSGIPFEREPNFMARQAAWQRDTLNARSTDIGFGTQVSVLDLSAQLDRRREPRTSDTPRGQLTEVRDTALVFGGPRRIRVWTPAGHVRGADLPLLVLTDADGYLDLMATRQVLDELMTSRRIPPLAVAFVDTPNATRGEDLNCNVEWSGFLAERVVPSARRMLGAEGSSIRAVVGGYSLGGLAAACAALDHPDVFGGVLAQSGSFYRGSDGGPPELVARRVAAGQVLPVRFALSIGELENATIPSRDPSMLTANRHLRDVLEAKGYVVLYQEGYHGHEHIAWQAQLAEQLAWLFGQQ